MLSPPRNALSCLCRVSIRRTEAGSAAQVHTSNPSTRKAEADPSLSSIKANLVYSFRTEYLSRKEEEQEDEEEREKRKLLGTCKLKISRNVYRIETKFLVYHG